jgi:hypothetical protein
MGAKLDNRLHLRNAVSRIQKHGALLVFPINNRIEPHSLWAEFFPKTKMVWDWNEDADQRVSRMWQLMKQLSDCREVVYSKWYQGRATFFSPELFAAVLQMARTSRKSRVWSYPRRHGFYSKSSQAIPRCRPKN